MNLRPLLFCAALCSSTLAQVPFASLETKVPHCFGQQDLGVAKEYFVEIANRVDGVVDYNALVKLFQQGEWGKLEEGLATFERVFESSPLREAATYLKTQMLWERVQKTETPEEATAERALKEALLLYPRSSLAPVLAATVANHWLRVRKFSRALALYTHSKETYPFHELKCVFQAGVAESHFQLHDVKSFSLARAQFEQKCNNPRLQVGLALRAAESNAETDPDKAAAAILKLESTSDLLLRRYFPHYSLFLGEHKYRGGKYASARFYFTEYTKWENADPACSPAAAKRLADVLLKEKRPTAEVVGQYLAAREFAKSSDFGRSAYVRALLLGYAAAEPAEKERRLRIVDEELELIKDEAIKQLGFLEKGLVLLGEGRLEAIGYLDRFAHKTHTDLKQGEIGEFIRSRLVGLLKTESGPVAESAYENWVKGTNAQRAGAANLMEAALVRAGQNLKEARFETALEDLRKIRDLRTGAAPPVIASSSTRHGLLSSLLAALVADTTSAESSLAVQYLAERDLFNLLLGPEKNLLWLVVSAKTGDEALTKKVLADKALDKIRDGYFKGRSANETDEYFLAVVPALMVVGAYGKAAGNLDQVKAKENYLRRDTLRIELAVKQKQYAKAFALSAKLIPTLGGDAAKAELLRAVTLAEKAKLTAKIAQLQQLAAALKAEPDLEARLLYFSGREAFRQGKCKQTIEDHEKALRLSPENSAAAGAKFELGKCLVATKNREKAGKVFRELASANDPFWAPLAKNELKLLYE